MEELGEDRAAHAGRVGHVFANQRQREVDAILIRLQAAQDDRKDIGSTD